MKRLFLFLILACTAGVARSQEAAADPVADTTAEAPALPAAEPGATA